MSQKQLQFELWTECNSRCKYCYLCDENRFTSEEAKLKMMDTALTTISDTKFLKDNGYDTISYLGGEFFQGQINSDAVRKKWFELMEKTAWLQKNDYIKEVWIYATMTLGDQQDLFDTLKLFECSEERPFWVLTSFDTIGRFHNPKMLDTWITTMTKIHELYPAIKFNTTTILTGDLIDKYLDGTFSFKDMMERYHTSFFLKHCGRQDYYKTNAEMNEHLPNFFPTRDKFLKFLIKFKREESELMWSKLFDIYYRADTLYRYIPEGDPRGRVSQRTKDGSYSETCGEGDFFLPCGHMNKYAAYSDSDKCCLCDKLMIDNMSK